MEAGWAGWARLSPSLFWHRNYNSISHFFFNFYRFRRHQTSTVNGVYNFLLLSFVFDIPYIQNSISFIPNTFSPHLENSHLFYKVNRLLFDGQVVEGSLLALSKYICISATSEDPSRAPAMLSEFHCLGLLPPIR